MAVGVVFLRFVDQDGNPIEDGAPVAFDVIDDDGGLQHSFRGNTAFGGIVHEAWDLRDSIETLARVEGKIVACGRRHDIDEEPFNPRVGKEEIFRVINDVSALARGNFPDGDVKSAIGTILENSTGLVAQILHCPVRLDCEPEDEYLVTPAHFDVGVDSQLVPSGWFSEKRRYRYTVHRRRVEGPVDGMVDFRICFEEAPESGTLKDHVTVPEDWKDDDGQLFDVIYHERCIEFRMTDDSLNAREGTFTFEVCSTDDATDHGFATVNISVLDDGEHSVDDGQEREVIGPSFARLVDAEPTAPEVDTRGQVLLAGFDPGLVPALREFLAERGSPTSAITLPGTVVLTPETLEVGVAQPFGGSRAHVVDDPELAESGSDSDSRLDGDEPNGVEENDGLPDG